jgi:hypothetical protein
MEMHAANDAPESDYAIEALFLLTLIFLALFVSCVLAWKAIAWLHNRRKFDGVATEAEHLKKPYVPEGFGRALGDGSSLSHLTDMGGFSEKEEEEFLLHHGPKKVRNAIKERRKAREQAQKKQQSDS